MSRSYCQLYAFGFLMLMARLSYAQLQITEVMFDSRSLEPRWEWFELQNTSGSPIDLHGGYFRDIGGNDIAAPNIDNTATANTVVPAGGVAVVYNSAVNTDAQFRQAWGLGGSVPLIGVATNWSSLNNSGGDQFGIWADATAFNMDLSDDGMGNLEVVQFNNSLVNVDYGPFMDGGAGVSSYWEGSGSITDPMQWDVSVAGVAGAVSSNLVTSMSNINSTDDVGNPGLVPAGPQAAGLLISEIMYNPRSGESDWEWVEVVNNTGATIDFTSGGYFIDDVAGSALGGANITSGSIADGEVAILYNDTTLAADFEGAWGAALNAIPVSSWPSLNNNNNNTTLIADTLGIWSSAASYNADDRGNGDFDGALASVTYENATNGWPDDDGNGSIYLSDLNAVASIGANWLLSGVGDGVGSFNATGVGGTVVEHNGGDLGSPGSVPSGMVCTVPGDLDCNGQTGASDLDLVLSLWGQDASAIPPEWVHDLPTGIIGSDELDNVLMNWGASEALSVPEPATGLLAFVAGLLATMRRLD